MHVNVKAMGALRGKLPGAQGGVAGLEVAEGAAVADALQQLGLTPGQVHLVMVNGEMETERSRALTDGDEIVLFPPVAGGMQVERPA